jgi:tetratricopeptide (TPR) repeat protein
VAKAPPPAAQTGETASAKASAAKSATAPTEGGKTEVAQLGGRAGVPPTAADLIRQAHDYMFWEDSADGQACLEQAVAVEQGTPDAGRARVLLASAVTESDPARAQALFAEVAQDYTDAEVLAFANLVRASDAATRAQDWPSVESLLSAAATTWRGTWTGGWAALRLGDHYRWDLSNYDQAALIFQAVRDEYGTGPVAEEAAISLAESVNRAQKVELAEVIGLFQDVLDSTHYPAFARRAMVGLGECYEAQSDWAQCWDTLSEIINADPTHPVAARAAIMRAYADQRLGRSEMAVEDAEFYLARGVERPLWRTYANYLLAQDAFRGGRYEEAEAQFALVAELAEDPQATEFGGAARAGIAACRETTGDRRGALTAYLEAADYAVKKREMAVYLYEAAGLAQEMGDSAAFQRIVDRMVAELPGSHLTTKLVGHEVLPAPEI